jgi:hypothetical protein
MLQLKGHWATVLLSLAAALALAACAAPQLNPRLRITNSGTVPIENLTVIFPDERIPFGDIAAGATTDYADVPKGVYNYAAYELEVNGQLVTQPVIDWVGEEPIEGSEFTYTIDFDPSRPALQVVQLLNVTKDR